jgi:hypothetical protein
MRRRWTVAVLVTLLVVGPVAATLPADALSSPNSKSSDIDIVFQDSNNNLKYVDAAGNVADLNVQTNTPGGIADINGDGAIEVVYLDTSDNLKHVDVDGNVVDIGVDPVTLGGIGDVDGDGDLDIAYRDSNSNLKYVDSAGNTVDTGVDTFNVGGIGDVDGDGDLDIAYRNSAANSVEFIDSAGNVVDTGVDSFVVGGIGDVDGDGDLDIAYKDRNGNMKYVDAAGNSVDTGVDGSPGGIGDIDDDGDLDMSVLDGTIKYVDGSSNVANTGVSGIIIGGVADIDGDGLFFDPPTVDNSTADPTGGVRVTSSPVTLEIDVNDTEFSAGDTVTVEFINNGQTVGTDTLTSNRTASVSVSSVDAGTNNWYVKASDAGRPTNSQRSQNFTFNAPATLTVRDEQNQTVIGNSGNVSVTFFGDGTVEERQISNGTADLSGLPTGERLVAVVEADGYRTRRVILPSLFEQQTAYLLADSADAATVTFLLEDPTGEFPPEETSLIIEKPITTNGTTEYRVLSADEFGATARYIVDLAPGARYRLRVRSGDRERLLGPYTVSGDTVQPLQIQRIEPAANERQAGDVYGGVTSDGDLAVRFRGGDDDTSVKYNVTNSSGATVVPSTTRDAAQFADIHAVNATGETFTVEYEVRDGGQVVTSGSFTAGEVSGIATRFNMDAQILSLLSWASILMTMGLVVIVNHQLAPAAGTGVAAGLVIIGTVAIPAPILGVAGALSALALFGGRG